jgi:hypothetical protein
MKRQNKKLFACLNIYDLISTHTIFQSQTNAPYKLYSNFNTKLLRYKLSTSLYSNLKKKK